MQDALFDADQAETSPSWVYVIGAEHSSVVKIGKADNVRKRLYGIQTSNPDRLVVRWQTPGTVSLERRLHDRFKSIRLAGEWFDFGTQDPVEAIRSAVEELAGRVIPAEPAVSAKSPGLHGPWWDIRTPQPSDPDCDNPDFQPTARGCRYLTPTELAAAGYPEDDLYGHIWCFCTSVSHSCRLLHN